MFGLFEREWEYSSMPDMSGKNAIVTGGSSGLGKHSSLELARKGANVYVVGRNEEKTKSVIDWIKEETSNQNVFFLKADFMDLKTVVACADSFIAKGIALHVLLNNAGIMANPYALSVDGIESQFATNHFAPFVFTLKLLPILEKTIPSRIVNVTSLAHIFATSGIYFDKLNDEAGYSPYYRYGETKLANILFTKHLARLIAQKGLTHLYVNCAHPGSVATDLTVNSMYIPSFVRNIFPFFIMSTDRGAKTQVYLAADPEIENEKIAGKHYIPVAKQVLPNKYATDEALAQELWDWTIKIVSDKIQMSLDYC